jgi:hypothetical protein
MLAMPMRASILYMATILLLFAFSSKLLLNACYDAETRKANIALLETDETKDEKTEKDNYKEKSELIHQLTLAGWHAHATDKAAFFNTNTHILSPIHFLAVPTPPPWA